MSYSDVERLYYPEEYDNSLYYETDFQDYDDPVPSLPPIRYSSEPKKPVVLPTINYLNERKCPIYIHDVRKDSSVYNNYGQKWTTHRTSMESPKVLPQNTSKFVLDKLEETYWATWKPKKENLPVKKESPRKGLNMEISSSKVYTKGSKKHLNKPHGDVNENLIKYFRARDVGSSSTAAAAVVLDNPAGKSSSATVSAVNETTENKKFNKRLTRPRKLKKVSGKDSISQEIQTEVHCPVLLQQTSEDVDENTVMRVIFEKEEGPTGTINIPSEEDNEMNKADEITTPKQQEIKKNKQQEKPKPEEKSKKHQKNNKKSKKDNGQPSSVETDKNSDITDAFVQLKDSIEIAKEKQERSAHVVHYQQPKCIRLYRKSGATTTYIKGGTYPLKSCLKKDSFPKGNFRLGAPGSPLFITTSSFSNRRKK